jgi:hypothetical protein
MTHKLFLIDSIGAAISVVAALAVAQMEHLFGAPPTMMYALASLAPLFFLYSFTCYWRKVDNWRVWMKILATLNLLYCCLTAGLVAYFFERMTVLGLLFFGGEILIIVTLAVFEYKTARN